MQNKNIKSECWIVKAFSRNRPQMSESMGYVKKNRMTTFYDTVVFSGIGMGK